MENDLLVTDDLLDNSNVNSLVGGSGDDSLLGSNDDDDIRGRGGNDTLDGLGGNDTLRGNAGNDNLFGGVGDDELRGGGDDDNLDGSIGNDTLRGGGGNDILRDDQGNNVLNGGEGNDLITGGSPEPRTFGDPIPRFGDVNDDLYGGGGNDTLDGGEGFDRLTGGGGQDVFILSNPGTGFENVTDFQDGVDKIQVPESPRFQQLSISNTFIGSSPDPFVTVSNRGIILGAFSSLDSPDQLTEEDFIGLSSPLPEGMEITGTDGDDSLVGGGGNDTIDGLAGNDTIDGGEGGGDRLIGRGGQNTYILRQDGGSDELLDYNPTNGDRIVLPEGLTNEDIDIVDVSGLMPSIRADGQRIALISSTIDLDVGGITTQDVRNSFITFEEFQGNSGTDQQFSL